MLIEYTHTHTDAQTQTHTKPSVLTVTPVPLHAVITGKEEEQSKMMPALWSSRKLSLPDQILGAKALNVPQRQLDVSSCSHSDQN